MEELSDTANTESSASAAPEKSTPAEGERAEMPTEELVEQDERRFVVVIQAATDGPAGISSEATAEFTRLATAALELTRQEASRS